MTPFLNLLVNAPPQDSSDYTDNTFLGTLSISTEKVVADSEKCAHYQRRISDPIGEPNKSAKPCFQNRIELAALLCRKLPFKISAQANRND